MNEPSFNLVQIWRVIHAWKKQLLVIFLFSLVVSIAVAFLIPPQYTGQVIFIPASQSLGDRSNLFREDFELPGDYFGNGNDLDRLLAIAQSPSVIRYLVSRFSLVNYYDINPHLPHPQTRAAHQLKKQMQIEKTELSTLRLTVWDHQPKMAADLANAAVEKIREENQQLLVTARSGLVQALQKHLGEISRQLGQLPDSLLDPVIKDQLIQADLKSQDHYRSLVGEFQTSLDNQIPNLYILSAAYPAQKPAYPVKWVIIVGITLTTLFFSVLFIGLLDYYRRIKPIGGDGE